MGRVYKKFEKNIKNEEKIGLKFDAYTLIKYAQNLINTSDQWNESINKKCLVDNLKIN